jgi:hypothetical protein
MRFLDREPGVEALTKAIEPTLLLRDLAGSDQEVEDEREASA